VIVGFGVNLAHQPDDLARPATSLAALTGAAPEPSILLEALVDAFARWLSRWRGAGVAAVRAAWLAAAHPAGTALSTHASDGTVLQGLFEGLDDTGALRLRLPDGADHIVHAGDVFLL
jgi:BirA family biotin operon repressor/biotin-[acetyl-CoA-carboxylase] ligase